MFATVVLLFNKTNNMQNPFEQLNQLATGTGLALMTAAVMTGMVEMPDHGVARAVLPLQTALAPVPTAASDNPLRREREESAPHYISYSVAQRTPGRASKK
jgi:hypothetical protein